MNKKTMIKSALSLFAIAGMALLATSAVRGAGDQDFTLVNKTGVEIHALHCAPHSSDEWGEDILGKDTLADGDSMEIQFGKHDRAHHWDLRVEDSKGNSLTWENLDLMQIEQVTLHYKDGKAWADLK